MLNERISIRLIHINTAKHYNIPRRNYQIVWYTLGFPRWITANRKGASCK